MKDVKLFIMDTCPYCKRALKSIEELQEEHEELKELKIHLIEERKEKALADSYDYYYVPTFYINEVKVHEGAIEKDKVLEILKSAL